MQILEVEEFEAIIIFVRTKNATAELAEKLEARGHSATALNGDMSQQLRERAIERLKNGKLDIIVATDVAARGIDVTRVSHVINYDIPYDTEAYVHRIGRTGRAGRSGKAILFVAPREKRMLRSIERATQSPIAELRLPSHAEVTDKRIEQFKPQLSAAINGQELGFFRELLISYTEETGAEPLTIATALAFIAQQDKPLLQSHKVAQEPQPPQRERQGPRPGRDDYDAGRQQKRSRKERVHHKDRAAQDVDMETFRLEVGHRNQVRPGDIVGAIANEADIDSAYIGQIKIHDDYSTVDLPQGMPDELFQHLKKTRVRGQPIRISRMSVDKEHSKKRDKARP